MKKFVLFLIIAAGLAAVSFGCRTLADRIPSEAHTRPDQVYRNFAALFDNRTYLSGW